MSDVESNIIKQISGFHDIGFTISPSNERAGDIICCWSFASFRESIRVVSLVLVQSNGVGLLWKNCRVSSIFTSTSTNFAERATFFQFLISFVLDWEFGNFIIFGDFNATPNSEERWSYSGFNSAVDDSVSLVGTLGLQDLPVGSSFLYFSCGSSGTRSWLDGFLVSEEAGKWCHSVMLRVILKMVTNHIPIVLSSGRLSSKRRPFKFFNIWCKDKEL